jgi:TolA-binding protein
MAFVISALSIFNSFYIKKMSKSIEKMNNKQNIEFIIKSNDINENIQNSETINNITNNSNDNIKENDNTTTINTTTTFTTTTTNDKDGIVNDKNNTNNINQENIYAFEPILDLSDIFENKLALFYNDAISTAHAKKYEVL